MMAKPIRIRMVYNKLPEIGPEVERRVATIIAKAAFDVQAGAQILAPVDTGALKNSIYVSTSRDSTYRRAVQEALKANPKAEIVDEVRPSAPLQVIVGAAVRYAPYVEFGTRRMAARPYLRPAVDRVKDAFFQALAAVLRRAG